MTLGESIALLGLLATLIATIINILKNSVSSDEIKAKLEQIYLNQVRQQGEMKTMADSIKRLKMEIERIDEELGHIRGSIRDLGDA